ncbi:transposase [Corynebacterium diphtheriae]|uniref:transposase n=1 Tax=Corynebacterium diphtheriae TaxID=1717 RepID=UPI0023AA37C6|nr:transposase [Corynebacterium diphtheriae]
MHCALKSATVAEWSTSPRTWQWVWILTVFKHILGLWIAKEEGASFWAQVCANLSNRGVKDVFIVCCDGYKKACLKQSRQPGRTRWCKPVSCT